MATMIHETTLRVMPSVNTPDYPSPPWHVFNVAKRTQIEGVPKRYWKWDAQELRPVEMDAQEKSAVDTGILEGNKEAIVKGFDVPIPQETVIALALTVLDDRNATAAAFNTLKNAIANANDLAEVKAAAAGMADLQENVTPVQMRAACKAKL